jgi:hypothetical protein
MTEASSTEEVPRSGGRGAWWLGSAGIALVLAATGTICTLMRKRWPTEPNRLLRVIGRVNLSPRHSIVLVQAGDRVLLIGTGSQGAPSMLGELTGNDLPEEFSARTSLVGGRADLGPEDEE